MLLTEIPGYTRAAYRAARLEDYRRDFAFLGIPEKIAGRSVQLMTLRMFLELCVAGSPFLHNGRVGPEHVTQFLWRLSPDFVRHDRARFAAFVEELTRNWKSLWTYERAINRFLDRMLLDKPPTNGGPANRSDTSFAASLIHDISSSYGWSDDEVLDTALPRLFQYLRRIQRDRAARRGETFPVINPLVSRLTRKIVARNAERLEREAREALANESPAPCPQK